MKKMFFGIRRTKSFVACLLAAACMLSQNSYVFAADTFVYTENADETAMDDLSYENPGAAAKSNDTTEAGISGNSINYVLSGGSQNPENPTSYSADKKTKLYSPERTGYKFGGWYTDPSFSKKTRVSKIKKGTQGDITLYAKWIPKKYKISYKLGKGGKNNKSNPKKYTVETDTIVLLAPTSKKGEFLGWYSDKECTVSINSIDTSLAKNVVVYAKWKYFTTKVNYNNIESVREAELELINKNRSENGVSSLVQNDLLNQAAQVRAKEIATKFSHTRPDESSCFTAMSDAGYTYLYAGENIAMGQSSVSNVMTAWMNSSGHRANILSDNYTEVGIGYYKKGGRKYWVQMFGTPR